MTSDRQTKEAMLNVKDERQYAPGSLLERFEKQVGYVQLIRGKEKQREIYTEVDIKSPEHALVQP